MSACPRSPASTRRNVSGLITAQAAPRSLPSHAALVVGDETRLTRIFSNLLNNAVKYTPPGGRIDVDLRHDGAQAVFTVSDSGVGLSAQSLNTVFNMFSQVVDHGDGLSAGLGVGLSLVQSLVELHRGSVSVRSEGEGLGCVFEVRLPLADPKESESLEPEAPSADSLSGRPLRIMVVDDNVDAAESLAILLQALGHDAAVAFDGVQALELAGNYRPDIVFLDIGMPRMNGHEVAAALRATPGFETTVLIALTGWGSPRDREWSRGAGFDHHLTKPASPTLLRHLLDQIDPGRAAIRTTATP